MRPALVILLIVLACASGGCTTARLRQRTVSQGSTLPELQYQQVLDNLALFAGNPASLPWHLNIREGTTQITDSISGGALVDLGPPASTEPQVFGSRTAVAQWGIAPVVDPTELRLLRFAYRRASGIGELPAAEFFDDLAHELKGQLAANADLQHESAFFYGLQGRDNPSPAEFEARVVTTNDTDFVGNTGHMAGNASPLVRNTRREVDAIARDLARIEPGWFHTGGKKDVPRDACYVGRNGDRYAWVCADGREQLTEFTLTILRFAALIKANEPPAGGGGGSVKFSPGDRGG